jgi:hypothetical protein
MAATALRSFRVAMPIRVRPGRGNQRGMFVMA